MCVNYHKVFNKYIGRSLWVPCGHCPACQQKKAGLRANRIRMAYKDGYLPFFVTLTYDNYFVPYVRRSDLNLPNIPIRRDFKYEVRGVSQGDFANVLSVNSEPIGYINNDSELDFRSQSLKHLRGASHDKIGVCYYPDLQNFIKLLRISYERKFYEKLDISYFACSEYGGKSQRPHFHLLIFIPSFLEGWFRAAVASCWKFGNRVPNGRYVEVARDAASYVSSYVNGNSSLAGFLSLPDIKQKHSYSKGFGTDSDVFGLLSILSKKRERNITYFKETRIEGVSTRVELPIPSYVINRFFPKFKGFSRIAPSQLFDYISNPDRLCEFRTLFDYSVDDLHAIQVRLNHCIDYYCKLTGLTKYDYARDFVDVWSLRSSYALKQSLMGVQDWYQHYYDILDFTTGAVSSNLFVVAPDSSKFVIDPNLWTDNISETIELSELYHKMTKQKYVTNYVMVQQGVCV